MEVLLLERLGGEGHAFTIAQTRLGGGRIHHAMRTIELASKALDMMCERGLWPSGHIPRRLAATRERYAEYLEHKVGNQ